MNGERKTSGNAQHPLAPKRSLIYYMSKKRSVTSDQGRDMKASQDSEQPPETTRSPWATVPPVGQCGGLSSSLRGDFAARRKHEPHGRSCRGEEEDMEERRGLAAWCYATTWHGVIDLYLAKDRNIAIKVFWLLTLLLIFAMTGYNVAVAVAEFSTDPHYTTSLHYTDNGYALFPPVQVCSLNRLKKSSLKALNVTTSSVTHVFGAFPASYPVAANEKMRTKHEKKFNKTLRDIFDRQYKGSVRWMLAALGPQCSDLLHAGCTFAGENFDCCSNATPVVNQFGQCWLLDLSRMALEVKEGTVPVQKIVGSGGGLSLEIDPLSDDVLVQFVCAMPFQLPNRCDWLRSIVDDYVEEGVALGIGFEPYLPLLSQPVIISTGSHAYVSLKNQQVSYTKPEFTIYTRKCAEASDEATRVLKGDYTRDVCQFECVAAEVRRECGCEPWMELRSTNGTICHPDVYRECFRKARKSNKTMDCIDECQHPCGVRFITELQTNAVDFPGPNKAAALKETLSSEADGRRMKMAEKVSDLILVDVYFSTLQLAEVDYTERMSLIGLVGNIGGQLGLGMGVSIVTLVQLVFFLIDCAVHRRPKRQ